MYLSSSPLCLLVVILTVAIALNDCKRFDYLDGVVTVMICTFDLDGLAQQRLAQHCYYCYSAILLFCTYCYYSATAAIITILLPYSHSSCYCYSVIVLQLLELLI